MATRFRIQFAFQTGQIFYVILHDAKTNTVWDNVGKVWEAFNAAHWARYAIALTEQGASGYYSAAYPAEILAVLTSEVVYQQAAGAPATSDAPAGPVQQSQGQNVAAVAGDADVPDTLEQNLVAVARGLAAGVPTASVIPTNLAAATASVYAGRSIVFTSGVAAGCAGRIIGYAVLNGVLTLAAPLALAPDAGDKFVVV